MKKNDAELNKLKVRVERWRRKKASRREAMPEELWREAARLGGVYSVSRVSAELGLHRGRLSGRLPDERESAQAQGHFVSMELPNLKRSEARDCLCEWVRPDGARLRVRIVGGALEGVVATFLGSKV